MPDCLLRRAIESDVPRLVELARRSWLSAFETTAPAALVDYWRSLDREPRFYAKYWDTMTVAERSGVVVGREQPCHVSEMSPDRRVLADSRARYFILLSPMS